MSKTRGRPFQPGNPGGPGRPQGSRNRGPSEADEIWEAYEPHVARKTVAMAGDGNTSAIRMYHEQLRSSRSSRESIDLRKVKSAEDAVVAAERITRRVCKGTLSTARAEKLMNILEKHLRFIESSDLEKRLRKVEECLVMFKKLDSA